MCRARLQHRGHRCPLPMCGTRDPLPYCRRIKFLARLVMVDKNVKLQGLILKLDAPRRHEADVTVESSVDDHVLPLPANG
uniref:Uncharacterized protein n=1 Tax=Oryza meridionalis TaxID=40149 RepID=A0A0E0F918_9ORYZ